MNCNNNLTLNHTNPWRWLLHLMTTIFQTSEIPTWSLIFCCLQSGCHAYFKHASRNSFNKLGQLHATFNGLETSLKTPCHEDGFILGCYCDPNLGFTTKVKAWTNTKIKKFSLFYCTLPQVGKNARKWVLNFSNGFPF
jgi:hypothetical protein